MKIGKNLVSLMFAETHALASAGCGSKTDSDNIYVSAMAGNKEFNSFGSS